MTLTKTRPVIAQPTSKLHKLTLAMLQESMHFNVEFQAEDAVEFVKCIEPSNRITDLPGLLTKINQIMPKSDNEYNGRRPALNLYRIGREYSLVIYVELGGFNASKIGGPLMVMQLVERVKAFAKTHGADEADLQQSDPVHGLRIRLWWD